MTEEEKRTKQAIELYKHFTEVTDIYVATKGYPMPCAVPMRSSLMRKQGAARSLAGIDWRNEMNLDILFAYILGLAIAYAAGFVTAVVCDIKIRSHKETGYCHANYTGKNSDEKS